MVERLGEMRKRGSRKGAESKKTEEKEGLREPRY